MYWYEMLKALRSNFGESMSKTADALGIPKGTYASYEYGNREPSIEMIIKIAEHFNVTVDYLLGREQTVSTESLRLNKIKEHIDAINDILND